MPVVDVGDGQMDVVSRLLKDRILLLGTQVGTLDDAGLPAPKHRQCTARVVLVGVRHACFVGSR